MATGELTPSPTGDARMGTAGSDGSTREAAGRGLWRVLGPFLVSVAGLLAVAWAFPESTWAWALWIVVGMAAGSIAGRGRLVWLAWLGVAAFYALAGLVGMARLGPY